MLRFSFRENEAAVAIERAVEATLAAGTRTADLTKPGEASVSTVQMARAIMDRLRAG
jgi:3-isopropylmalate dehydrogenase